VDTDPPVVTGVQPTSPTSVTVHFSERVASTAADITRYSIELRAGGTAPTVTAARLTDAGRSVVLTTSAQARQAGYTLVVSNIDDLATPPNRLTSQRVDFDGFGDSTPPELVWAKAVTPSLVVLKFSETVDAASAGAVANYAITGINVMSATASNSPDVARSAFNENWAPVAQNLVVLATEPMQPGRMFNVTATGVLDQSANPSASMQSFMSVSEAPTVTVEIRYLISATAQVVGVGQGGAAATPARAISPSQLTSQREGVFILGTALSQDGSMPVTDSPVTMTLGGFPTEGSPLDGAEPQLKDDGTNGDMTANDNDFTIVVSNVPLGTVLSYKAFASYSVAYQMANPNDPLAAFADATPGPRVFGDGQEYPGNDNAAWILADENGDGRVVLDNLYGDEITFKRKTGFRPFAWVTDTWRRQE